MPGDTVKMENDQLTINGKKYDEPYLDKFKKNFQKISYKESMLIVQGSKHKQKVPLPLRAILNILCRKESILFWGITV
ncbi:S26 family signal peptidase [Enterococcus lactis]|nr:S26 family signal peptidase [Enterococcus lactis]